MLHKTRDVTLSRLQSFVNRKDLLRDRVTPLTLPLFPWLSRTVDSFSSVPPPSFSAVLSLPPPSWRQATPSEKLSPMWSTVWFRITLPKTLPSLWEERVRSSSEIGRFKVCLRFDSGCEATLWSKESGGPVGSFTGTSDDTQRDLVFLEERELSGRVLYVECACNEMFGNTTSWEVGPAPPPSEGRTFELKKVELALFDCEADGLLWDLSTMWELAKSLPETSCAGNRCMFVADRAVNECVLPEKKRSSDTRWSQRARDICGECLRPQCEQTPVGKLTHVVTAVGNCHIDTAWLWPYRETRRKCVRSWSAQLGLIEEYPEMRFAVSQAQQMQWVKQDSPVLFERIREAVEKGSFVPVGGTWVEMDCNMPSGESLVRQFLLGSTFFNAEFGVARATDVFWLPDTFGYSAQLPQILRGCGISRFVTQKLSWNQFNKWPLSTFVWQGLDGGLSGEVVTHFPPAETYTGRMDAAQLLKSSENNKDRERCRRSLLLFGHGDGGGGPQRQMVERLRRLHGVRECGAGEMPEVCMGTPKEFFDKVDEERRESPLLVWKGELYFELHRGTYTSQARNKWSNRKAETLLHDLEALSVMAASSSPSVAWTYPAEELTRLWEMVCLNQFHDVIPGSSIQMVYEDSAEMYRDVFASGGKLLSAAAGALTGGQESVVVNTLEWDRKSVVRTSDGALALASAPALGWARLENSSEHTAPTTLRATATVEEGCFVLENQFLRASFCRKTGLLVSLLHKETGREAVGPSGGNRFVMFEDVPNYWDAWDVDIFHLEKPLPLNLELAEADVVESGPLLASVRFKWRLTDHCVVSQRVELSCCARRIDFVTDVADWTECQKFLKVEFDTGMGENCRAVYDTQFGWLERPNNFNTSWEMAKFEVCAHRFVDLGEFSFGVSFLNDCKYGHACRGGLYRLSLLRAPKFPDDTCDMGQGIHHFTYSVFPHSGDFRTAGTIRQSADLNVPLLLFPPVCVSAAPAGGVVGATGGSSMLAVSHEAVSVEAVKMGDSGSVVVRVCERFGGSWTGVKVWCPSGTVRGPHWRRVDLLERPLLDEKFATCGDWDPDRGITFDVGPFQILTFQFGKFS